MGEETVHSFVMDEDPNQNKRVVESDKFDESEMPEEAERGYKYSMEEFKHIKEDIKELMKVKGTHDDKDMKAALTSLYEEGKALKEKGVLDDSDLKEMEETVHSFVMDEDPNQNKRVVDSDKFDESNMPEEAERGYKYSMEEFKDIKEDIKKIKEAKGTHDDK